MRRICLVIYLVMIVSLAGCTVQPKDAQAFEAVPRPSLEWPQDHVIKSGPLVVGPTRVALGEEIEVKIEDVKPEAMAGLGIALLDPTGARISAITPVQPTQAMTVPADGKPGAYKVWLAKSTFAANTGINLVVLDVYDGVPQVLRNPDPLRVVDVYLNAISQKDYALAWQALSSRSSTSGRAAWASGFEAIAQSIRIIKISPQSIPLKETDQSYRCSADLEIKTRAKGLSLGRTIRTTRHFTMTKESGGWRIDRISMLP